MSLESGVRVLIAASVRMALNHGGYPAEAFPSISGIGAIVIEHLLGLEIARAALADASRTASEAFAAVMAESTAIDAHIADYVSDAYALEGGPSR